MVSLGRFPSQVQYNTLLHNPITQYLQFPSKPHFSFSTRFNFNAVLGKTQNGLCCEAFKKTKKKSDFGLAEKDGPDELEDDFDDEFLDVDDDGDFELEGDDDDEDDVVIPLKNMKKWVENRPRGFGEDKVYDTSIEDKLMEEIEQSRKAQLANLNKLKNSPVKKEPSKQEKGSTHIQNGFRVRLLSLPKKKNIHRDLQLAFKEVPGILNIVPVVSGNEKTRDPVCKGFAFVDFKYQDEAQRFVQNFSGKSISFGKVQKKIKCEMMTSNLPNPDESNFSPEKAVLNLNVNVDAGVETDVSPLDSWDQSDPSEDDDADERLVSAEWEDDEEINGTSTTSDSNLSQELQIGEESAINSSSSKQIRKLKTNEKKVASKRRKDKNPKFNIPGSANRLKIKEKEVLTGVFSKYGANATTAVKEQSR